MTAATLLANPVLADTCFHSAEGRHRDTRRLGKRRQQKQRARDLVHFNIELDLIGNLLGELLQAAVLIPMAGSRQVTIIMRKQRVRTAKPVAIVIAVPQQEASRFLCTVDAKDAMRHKSHH
jgi:hypothetical protein